MNKAGQSYVSGCRAGRADLGLFEGMKDHPAIGKQHAAQSECDGFQTIQDPCCGVERGEMTNKNYKPPRMLHPLSRPDLSPCFCVLALFRVAIPFSSSVSVAISVRAPFLSCDLCSKSAVI